MGAYNSRANQIIHKQEALALNLLAKADKPEVNIDVQMDVFERIAKWVAIKNKLENDDGGGIADYKRALSGETDKFTPSRRSGGRKDAAHGGARLEAIKSRLPAADDGGDDGDSGPARGEISPAAGGDRSLHSSPVNGGKP